MRTKTRLTLALLAILLVTSLALSQQRRQPPAGGAPEAKAAWEEIVAAGNEAADNADYTTAEKAFRRSLALAEANHMDASFIGGSNDALGFVLRLQRRYAEAEPFYRTALEQRRSFYPEEHFRVTQSKVGLGLTLVGLQQNTEAEKLFLELLAVAEKKPDVRACDLIQPLDALASLYRAAHQYDKGERVFVDTFAMLTQNQATPCEGYIGLLQDLAGLYTDANQWDKVNKIRDSSVQLALGMEGPNSELYGNTLLDKGQSFSDQKRYDEAAKSYSQAATVYRRTDPPSLDKLTDALQWQEINLYLAGHKAEGDRVDQELKTALEESYVGDPRGAMLSQRLKSIDAENAGHLEDAERYAARALEASKKLPPSDQMIAYASVASIHAQMHRLNEAEAEYKRVLELAIQSTGTRSSATAGAYFDLGWFYSAQKLYPEAQAAMSQAVSLYGPQDRDQMKLAYSMLANAYFLDGKPEKAEPVLKQAIELNERTHDDYNLSGCLSQLGQAYAKMNRVQEAETTLARGMSLGETMPKEKRNAWLGSAMAMASLYVQTNRAAQAEQLYIKIAEFTSTEFGADNAFIRKPLDKLIELLRSQGRLTEATQYEARRDKLPPLPPWMQ